MASNSSEGNGRRRIQFVAADGSRKSIRLGKVSTRQGDAFKLKVQKIIGASITGDGLDDETSRWVAELDDKMHSRLTAVGLVKPRQFQTMTLGAFIDAYIADRTDAKPRTIINFKQARKDLIDFFGEKKPLREITPGDADEFWRHLIRRLAPNTARRICGRAKQFFRSAIRKHLVTSNPFADLKSHVQGNTERDFFVTREIAQKVIDACPNAQWRLIFALSRFGGLRCPSEHLALKWSDVDWEHGRITVRSPKTEHHEGKGTRQIPIFPELRPHLIAVLEEAGYSAGAGEPVITRFRDSNANLRSQMERIIGKAGLVVWPKLFHNLRATRQNELAETYPAHVVCAWIGNSEIVARQHYLRVQDSHFEKAAQNAAHSGAILSGTEPSGVPQNAESRVIHAGLAETIPPRGAEQPANSSTNTMVFEEGGSESGSPPAQTRPHVVTVCPTLQAVVDAWPSVPMAVRLAVLNLIKSSKQGE